MNHRVETDREGVHSSVLFNARSVRRLSDHDRGHGALVGRISRIKPLRRTNQDRVCPAISHITNVVTIDTETARPWNLLDGTQGVVEYGFL